MRRAAPITLAGGLFALATFASACRALEPTNRPIDTCRRSCAARAAAQCSPNDCERGCEFILDRIVEREVDNVVACVARGPDRCGDIAWANCAARIGPHADGGPPAPAEPQEDE